jgi:CubicO group peptidase (beta-lactamase class C family)
MSMRLRSCALFIAASLMSMVPIASIGASQPIETRAIDRTVARTMKAFDVPGMAVGIVKDGELVFAKGYGVRERGKPEPVGTRTLFQIGSNTKAFTAAALAMLVDAGKLRWDDRVIDYLPQFRLYDAYVTREFTIRDLLSHRSGLGTGAGDLMFFPATDFSREELMFGLRYLKPVASFRSQYDYDNVLYVVAGEMVAAVSGESWEDFIANRILAPLGMTSCAPTYERVTDRRDMASPHVPVDGQLTVIPVEKLSLTAAAGAINCSVEGLAKWLQTQLAQGKSPSGQTLFSAERSAEMWSMNTIKSIRPELAELTQTHFAGYGLGWEVRDSFGRKVVSHTGGVPGTVTWISMVPELQLAVMVFTNQQSGVAMEVVGNQILDAYLQAPKRDWVDIGIAFDARRSEQTKAIEDEARKVGASASPPPLSLDTYAGCYIDAWRGAATVRRQGDTLILKFSRTDRLEGELSPYRGNVFIVRWNDRSLDADAYVRFDQGFGSGIERMSMQAVSPATDFSFDFQDLDFRKAQTCSPTRRFEE